MGNDQHRNWKLAQRLVAAGGLSPDDAAALVQEAERREVPVYELLCERSGPALERPVWERIAAQRNLRLSSTDELSKDLDATISASFPKRFLENYQVIPVSRRGGDLVVATCDPDVEVPEIAGLLGARRVDLRLLTPLDFKRMRMSLDLLERRKDRAAARAEGPRDLLSRDEGMTELVTLFEVILLDAIAARASDIHLERYDQRVRLRLRVDGDLRDLHHLEIGPEQLVGLINVIKIQANLDIAERRVPQGGRLSVRAGNRGFDLRVQTQPALHGEHVIIRLLPQDTELLTIEQLGFPEVPGRAYRRLIDSPSGLVLVVGPTGSGKSTTLYAGLQVLSRDPTRKVITIEDPIEYAIDDVQQSQVRPELGFVFASAMRSFVREDPDVILVGEIRDTETALEALRASQTGHLVLSTLHCNDAVDAVQRLLDLGMHANSIASEVLAVFAQRLAKRICTDCRAPAGPLTGELVGEVFPDGVPADFSSSRGRGCSRCANTGNHGRIAAVEFLPASPAFRSAVSRRLSVDELREVALDAGLLPMREHALDLIRAGVIAFEELRNLLPPERLKPEHGRRLAERAAQAG